MLTTASITSSATSAMLSGPRACACAASGMVATTSARGGCRRRLTAERRCRPWASKRQQGLRLRATVLRVRDARARAYMAALGSRNRGGIRRLCDCVRIATPDARRSGPTPAPATPGSRRSTADAIPTTRSSRVGGLASHAPSRALPRPGRRQRSAPRSRTPGRARPESRDMTRATGQRDATAPLRCYGPALQRRCRARRSARLAGTDRRNSGRSRNPAAAPCACRLCLEAGLVGLHRAVEGEEVRILAEGLGEDAVALGVALAADAARTSRLRLGDQHRHVAVGARRISCERCEPWARNSAASRWRSVCMRW